MSCLSLGRWLGVSVHAWRDRCLPFGLSPLASPSLPLPHLIIADLGLTQHLHHTHLDASTSTHTGTTRCASPLRQGRGAGKALEEAGEG